VAGLLSGSRGLEGGLGNSNQLVEERFQESHKEEETHPIVRTPMTLFGNGFGPMLVLLITCSSLSIVCRLLSY
jgi:hypothetical protein